MVQRQRLPRRQRSVQPGGQVVPGADRSGADVKRDGIGSEMVDDARVFKRIGIGFLLLLSMPFWPIVWAITGLYKLGKSFDEHVKDSDKDKP